MTEDDLSQIEIKLGISLPNEYRELMRDRSAELHGYGCFDDDFSPVYLDPDILVDVNTIERRYDAGTGYAFPNWWQTFYLIGATGGGEYFCLRLDNKPGVWIIGSDCGDKPLDISANLNAFIEEVLNREGLR